MSAGAACARPAEETTATETAAETPRLPDGVTLVDEYDGADNGFSIPYKKYRLDNGLTVLLHEDHSDPMVHVDVTYHVGSAREEPGRSGFAHLFEHLMFMGTRRVPGSGFDDIMEAEGGANNASTGTDRTNYFSWGPVELLPTLLWLDADRRAGRLDGQIEEEMALEGARTRLARRREGDRSAPLGREREAR